MAAAVTVRLARASDAPLLHAAIVAMAEGLGQESRVTSTPDDLSRHGFSARPAFEAVIAEVDGVFAGMCLYFSSFSTWRGRLGIYVQDIYVAPGFRGRRIGERMLGAVAARGRDSGAAYLRLSVDASNVAAQAFYTRLGIDWLHDERIHGVYGDAFAALADNGKREEGL